MAQKVGVQGGMYTVFHYHFTYNLLYSMFVCTLDLAPCERHQQAELNSLVWSSFTSLIRIRQLH